MPAIFSSTFFFICSNPTSAASSIDVSTVSPLRPRGTNFPHFPQTPQNFKMALDYNARLNNQAVILPESNLLNSSTPPA
jgi:hypothetical protein